MSHLDIFVTNGSIPRERPSADCTAQKCTIVGHGIAPLIDICTQWHPTLSADIENPASAAAKDGTLEHASGPSRKSRSPPAPADAGLWVMAALAPPATARVRRHSGELSHPTGCPRKCD